MDPFVVDLEREFGAYEMPIREARDIIDAALGDTTLNDLLEEARAGRP